MFRDITALEILVQNLRLFMTFKDFQGPFDDFQGSQTNLTIFQNIPGLELKNIYFFQIQSF